MFIFFNYIRKITVITEIFYVEILFPTCLFSHHGFLNKNHEFLRQREKRVFPTEHVIMTSPVPVTYRKRRVAVIRIHDVFTDSLALSGLELWPIISAKATIVADAGCHDNDAKRPIKPSKMRIFA